MTGYVIYYSDPQKQSYPIKIPDGTKDTNSTSLTLIGRNYPGYGQATAGDLLHLLENFASPTPPNNPIEGQLWFDTSDPNNKKLKINDGGISGTLWSPTNGVFQQSSQPTNVNIGDIWVDTANQQLKFYNGQDFTLVGPNYSSASRTGTYPLQWMDTLGVSHEIIINYVNGVPVEVIATEAFTPNPMISSGFNILKPGINISSSYPTIYGVADSASSLQLSIPASQKVSADNFLRKDISQTMKGALQILVNGNALQLGTNSSFILETRSGYDAAFVNNDTQGQYSFDVANNTIMQINGPNKLVRINNSSTVSPTSGIEVWGSMYVSNSATVNTLYVSSTLSNILGVPGNAIQIAGGAGIGGTLVVSGEHILKGPLTVGQTSGNPSVTSIVVPTQNNVYDLGDPTISWRNVYAYSFQAPNNAVASFSGIATSSTYLAQPSAFTITGDLTSSPINFRGGGQAVSMNVSPTVGLINNRTTATVTTGSDLMLVGTSTGLYSQKKRDFLADMNYQDGTDATINPGYSTPAGSLVPVGTILPYAGSVTNPPPGWLVCNGAAIPNNAKYQNLKNLIGYTYDPGNSTWKVPNLTGPLSIGTVSVSYIIKY